MGPLAAGEDPHRLGPVLQLVPARAFAQQPGQLGDVRFLDPAGPVTAFGVAAGIIGAALADLAAVIDRDLPRLLGDQPDRGLLPLIQFPPARVHQRVPAAGRQLVQVLQQLVAEPGAVHGHHQVPPPRRRQRRDRRVHQADVIGGRVAARRALAQHPRQRLPAGVIAERQQRIMAETFEIPLGQFLLRMGGGDGRVDPDARHALQGLVRDPHPGQRAVPRHDLRPRVAARGVDGSGQLLLHPGAAPGDLLQRPVRRRHRRDLPERLRLISQHPEITDRAGTVRDRARDVGQYPAPVMMEQPGR